MKHRFAPLAAMVAIAACASTKAAPATGTAGATAAEVNASGSVQYDGQFRPMQVAQGALGMSQKQNIFGSVRIIYREATNRSLVNLNVSTSQQQTDVMSWAVAPGRCGSGSVPLMPSAQFPALEIGNTGRGELTINDLAIAMPMATYHVNLYRGGETLANVMACANLTVK